MGLKNPELPLLTVSEEGPAGLASIEGGQGLLLLANKGVPSHLLRPPQLPHLLQATLQVVDGVVGTVVHQTCQQALEPAWKKTHEGQAIKCKGTEVETERQRGRAVSRLRKRKYVNNKF